MKTNFINTSLKVRANQIAFLYENLDKTIKEVKYELLQIASNDKETYITYKNKVYDLLNVWLISTFFSLCFGTILTVKVR